MSRPSSDFRLPRLFVSFNARKANKFHSVSTTMLLWFRPTKLAARLCCHGISIATKSQYVLPTAKAVGYVQIFVSLSRPQDNIIFWKRYSPDVESCGLFYNWGCPRSWTQSVKVMTVRPALFRIYTMSAMEYDAAKLLAKPTEKNPFSFCVHGSNLCNPMGTCALNVSFLKQKRHSGNWFVSSASLGGSVGAV